MTTAPEAKILIAASKGKGVRLTAGDCSSLCDLATFVALAMRALKADRPRMANKILKSGMFPTE